MSRFHKPDYLLIAVIGLITIFGIIMLSSASGPLAFEKFGDTYYFVKRQLLFGLLPGLILFLILAKIDYHALGRASWWFFGGAVFLMLLVFVPGIGASFGKTRSWIAVSDLFSFQPAEILKLAFILMSAWWLSRQNDPLQTWKGLLQFLILPAIVVVLLVFQPDIGTLLIFAAITAVMMFVAEIPWRFLAALAIVGLGGMAALIASAPYRARRLMTFLHPELDPQGIGYHINQALLAIGSGGVFGLGYGHSRQKYLYLPEVNADSIFAVIAEELGFIFSVCFVVALCLLLLRGAKIATRASDNLGRYLAIGIITWFITQSFINIAAMIGLLPLTGVPLPFVSHGGTALLTALAAAGILVNISRQTKL